jgi:thiamine-phosphate pyrophosphorylase
MCLTQDGLDLSHAEQAEELCRAGARWIQLRMKDADFDSWVRTACEVVAVCRSFDAICIVNDSVDVALAAGADGVHLGREDLDWSAARRRLGLQRILGGTINNAEDAQRAVTAKCLNYAGVGPWRFTKNKRNLAPVLGADGVRRLVEQLGNLPVWVIGGVEAADLPDIRALGATGVAVSSALYRGRRVRANFRALALAWSGEPTAVGKL